MLQCVCADSEVAQRFLSGSACQCVAGAESESPLLLKRGTDSKLSPCRTNFIVKFMHLSFVSISFKLNSMPVT